MKWTRISILCVLGLSLNCTGEGSFVSGDIGGGEGLIADYSVDGTVDWEIADALAPDIKPGVIDELEGHIATLGGPASMTVETFEGKPTYELDQDGLEYAGIHGALCSADQDYCITEGGIAP